MVEQEKSFCTQIKEQIVDEKHAASLYSYLLAALPVVEYAKMGLTRNEGPLIKTLINKIATDESSHLKILEAIDNLVCHE